LFTYVTKFNNIVTKRQEYLTKKADYFKQSYLSGIRDLGEAAPAAESAIN
jgi:hypothetical protein